MATETKVNQEESSSFYEPINERNEANNYQFAAIPKPVKSKGKYRGDEKLNNPFGNKNSEKNAKPNSMGNPYRSSNSGNQLRKPSDRFRNDQTDQGLNLTMENVYENIVDRPIDDASKIKPDFYVDRPPTPEYKPKPKGVNVATQLDEQELFDFELESEPILQVLIGRCLENSKMELIEEHEKKMLEHHKAEFKKKRDAELMVTQRMEYAFIRRKEENERRRLQHEIKIVKNKQAHKKYVSSILSKQFLGFLKNNSMNQLEDHGFLRKSLFNDISREFLPWLQANIYQDLKKEDSGEKILTQFLENVQVQAVEYHTGFVKKEMEKRKKNEENRIRVQREIEEAKRTRKERRLAKRKMREKNEIFDNLKKFVIAYPSQNNDILDAEISDITGDKKRKPIVGILGGFVGTLYMLFKVLDEQLIALEKGGITQEMANEFILRFLIEKAKIGFDLKMNAKYQELIETNLKLMDENLDEFNLIKEELLENLAENSDLFLSNFTMSLIGNSSFIDNNVVKLLNKAFLALIFKSITYKDPPKKEEAPIQDVLPPSDGIEKNDGDPTGDVTNHENVPPPPEEKPAPKVYPPRPEPDQHDFDMLKGRSKLRLAFEGFEPEELPYNAILKLHTSLNYNAPKKEEEKEQIVNENEESFIEPFDGTSFEKLKEQYFEMETRDNRCQSFNIWQDARYKILVIDEKSQILLLKILSEYWRTIETELSETVNEEFLQRMRQRYEEFEMFVIKELTPEKDVLPIFDAEI